MFMLMQNSDTMNPHTILSCFCRNNPHLKKKTENIFIFLFKANSYSFFYMWCKVVVIMKIVFYMSWKMVRLNCNILPTGRKRKTNSFLFRYCQYYHVTECVIKKPAKSAHLLKHLLYAVNPLGIWLVTSYLWSYLTRQVLHNK